MGRPLRIIQTEYPYHIMTQTNNKDFHLKELPGKKILKIFITVLNEAIQKYQIKIFHFVLMDNHYHIILKLSENNLHRAFQFINSQLARKINKLLGRTGHLWRDRYKSSIIQDEEYYVSCVKYVYENPVNAGIAATPSEYERSSVSFYAFGKKIEIEISPDDLIVLKLGKDRSRISRYYRELFMSDDKAEHCSRIPHMLNKICLGDERFERYLREKYYLFRQATPGYVG